MINEIKNGNDVKHINHTPINNVKMVLTKEQIKILNDHKDCTNDFFIDDKGVYRLESDGLERIRWDDSIDFHHESSGDSTNKNDKIVLNIVTNDSALPEIRTDRLYIAINTMERLCYELFDKEFSVNDFDIATDDIVQKAHEIDDHKIAIEYIYKYESGEILHIGKITYDEEEDYSYISLDSEMQQILLEYAVNSTYGKFNS